LFRAILSGALYPNVIRLGERDRNGVVRRPKYLGRPSEGVSEIHSKSVNAMVWPKEPLWMVYFSKTRMENSSRPTIADSTIATLRDLLLLGGPLSKCQEGDCALIVGDWIQIQAESKVATLLKELRGSLDQLLLRKFNRPSTTYWDPSSDEGRLLHMVRDLLVTQPAPRVHNKLFNADPHSSDLSTSGRAPQPLQSSEDSDYE
uniref:OB_NTP_bind domain-containing protein n=1 Tax=Echinostoma caproni TaxID=27848 RepID=A0A183AWC5_9TREM